MLPINNIFDEDQFPNLLIGLKDPDDAAVWKINAEQAIVISTDFFTPVVDEAYDYGAISAANSISDIYAMGATPIFALSVAALPTNIPTEILSEIMRGAAEKAKEAGIMIAGGHTVQDKEPKFGLVVIGFAHPDKLLTKSGIQAGDKLILTKPLGVGVTTTAIKRGKASEEATAEAKASMSKLNANAAKIAVELGLKAATDITGFSLLGHAHEMASASNVKLTFFANNIPYLSEARKYGEAGYFAGGAADNMMHYQKYITFDKHIDEVTQMLLFDPQTSGGLLIACPPEKIDEFQTLAKKYDQDFAFIGEAQSGTGIQVSNKQG